MEERVFMDKQTKPTEQTLRDAFGNIYEQYKRLEELTSAYKKEWTFTKSSGWMLKVFDAKKALFYIIPFKNEIKISMTVRESEKDKLLYEECLSIYHERLQSAKKYIEGYALQFLISTEEDFVGVESLLNHLMSLRS